MSKENIGIFVGNKITKASNKKFVNNLIRLMEAGQNSEQEGKTIRHAMTMLQKVTDVHSVSVSDCIINVPQQSDNKDE